MITKRLDSRHLQWEHRTEGQDKFSNRIMGILSLSVCLSVLLANCPTVAAPDKTPSSKVHITGAVLEGGWRNLKMTRPTTSHSMHGVGLRVRSFITLSPAFQVDAGAGRYRYRSFSSVDAATSNTDNVRSYDYRSPRLMCAFAGLRYILDDLPLLISIATGLTVRHIKTRIGSLLSSHTDGGFYIEVGGDYQLKPFFRLGTSLIIELPLLNISTYGMSRGVMLTLSYVWQTQKLK